METRRQVDDQPNTLYHIRVLRVQGVKTSSLAVQVELLSADSTIGSSDPDLPLLTMFAVDGLEDLAICNWRVRCFCGCGL